MADELLRKALQIIELKEADGDVGKGTAVFATLNVEDHDGDLTLPGAFGEQKVKVLGAHNWGIPWLGSGKTYEEGEKALVDFELNLKQATAREWYEALKFDNDRHKLAEWSYGFRLKEWEYRDCEDHANCQIRVFKSVDVHEVSPVVLGAGIGTGTESIKKRTERDAAGELARWYSLQRARFTQCRARNW